MGKHTDRGAGGLWLNPEPAQSTAEAFDLEPEKLDFFADLHAQQGLESGTSQFSQHINRPSQLVPGGGVKVSHLAPSWVLSLENSSDVGLKQRQTRLREFLLCIEIGIAPGTQEVSLETIFFALQALQEIRAMHAYINQMSTNPVVLAELGKGTASEEDAQNLQRQLWAQLPEVPAYMAQLARLFSYEHAGVQESDFWAGVYRVLARSFALTREGALTLDHDVLGQSLGVLQDVEARWRELSTRWQAVKVLEPEPSQVVVEVDPAKKTLFHEHLRTFEPLFELGPSPQNLPKLEEQWNLLREPARPNYRSYLSRLGVAVQCQGGMDANNTDPRFVLQALAELKGLMADPDLVEALQEGSPEDHERFEMLVYCVLAQLEIFLRRLEQRPGVSSSLNWEHYQYLADCVELSDSLAPTLKMCVLSWVCVAKLDPVSTALEKLRRRA